jgi:hypothetical protein
MKISPRRPRVVLTYEYKGLQVKILDVGHSFYALIDDRERVPANFATSEQGAMKAAQEAIESRKKH